MSGNKRNSETIGVLVLTLGALAAMMVQIFWDTVLENKSK